MLELVKSKGEQQGGIRNHFEELMGPFTMLLRW